MITRTLKSVGQHCYDLAEALEVIKPYCSLDNACEWLRVAAAIKRVDVDWIRFDASFGWCSGPDNYELAKEKILKKFITKLTVFMYTWGAIEAAIEAISPPSHPEKSKRGKISNACHYICTYFDGRLTITPYLKFVGQFYEIASISHPYGRIIDQIKARNDIGPAGRGLFLVYKLRNSFSHGELVFPDPDSEDRPISDAPNFVECATRIVLLSIQMLAMANCADKDLSMKLPLSDEDYDFSFENNIVPLTEWLRVLHFQGKEAEEDQLPLF